MSGSIVVFGGSGFVGSAVVQALEGLREVRTITSPRLRTEGRTVSELEAAVLGEDDLVRALADELAGASAVINAAGDPDASALEASGLFGANALLPGVLLRASQRAEVPRFVHVSSAVVQNDSSVLDSSEDLRPFSPYSASKVAGEELVRHLSAPPTQVVRYRPPSVHAPGRRVTRMIGKIAHSPVASVARPGTQATPQALLPNVADAIAFLATTAMTPPAVVHHPSEGVTVGNLMRDLGGGAEPRRIPVWAARAAVFIAKAVGRMHKPTAANARRLELLWLGQTQAPSWLSEMGWHPPIGRDGWKELT